jgi:hypothetical protein
MPLKPRGIQPKKPEEGAAPTTKRRRSERSPTLADYEAFRSAAGGWSDVDVDTFLAENEASRRMSGRPPAQL